MIEATHAFDDASQARLQPTRHARLVKLRPQAVEYSPERPQATTSVVDLVAGVASRRYIMYLEPDEETKLVWRQTGDDADDAVDGAKQKSWDFGAFAVGQPHHEGPRPEAIHEFPQMILPHHLHRRDTTGLQGPTKLARAPTAAQHSRTHL